MRQIRITSEDFVKPGESLEPDAVLSEEDKEYLKTMTSTMPEAKDVLTYVGTMADLRKPK